MKQSLGGILVLIAWLALSFSKREIGYVVPSVQLAIVGLFIMCVAKK